MVLLSSVGVTLFVFLQMQVSLAQHLGDYIPHDTENVIQKYKYLGNSQIKQINLKDLLHKEAKSKHFGQRLSSVPNEEFDFKYWTNNQEIKQIKYGDKLARVSHNHELLNKGTYNNIKLSKGIVKRTKRYAVKGKQHSDYIYIPTGRNTRPRPLPSWLTNSTLAMTINHNTASADFTIISTESSILPSSESTVYTTAPIITSSLTTDASSTTTVSSTTTDSPTSLTASTTIASTTIPTSSSEFPTKITTPTTKASGTSSPLSTPASNAKIAKPKPLGTQLVRQAQFAKRISFKPRSFDNNRKKNLGFESSQDPMTRIFQTRSNYNTHQQLENADADTMNILKNVLPIATSNALKLTELDRTECGSHYNHPAVPPIEAEGSAKWQPFSCPPGNYIGKQYTPPEEHPILVHIAFIFNN